MRIYPKNVAIVVLILFGIPWLWMTLSGRSNAPRELLEIEDLKRRVQLSETIVDNKDRELREMQGKFKAIMADLKNNTNNSISIGRLNESLKLLDSEERDVTDIQPPSIYHYLPHLIGNRKALKPAFKLSQKRKKVSLVFGVPTIKRSKQEYLVDTIRSLLENLNEEEKSDVLIVVIVAEPWDMDYVKVVAAKLQENFKAALSEGVLELISPPADFYPDLNNLKENFGDSKDRVKWRTKQNLDFAFLMMYCRSRGNYYIQLEDDIVTKPGYASAIKTFTQQQQASAWLYLEFSRLGFIGKLFRTTDLSMVAEFFLMFHTDKPIDWLLDHILYVKACNPEKDNKHCGRSKQELKKIFKPSLFQHTGLHSSLAGKTQKLKDKDFGKGHLHRAHANPTAKVETSLKTYQKYTLESAYLGQNFFWALLPQAKDYVSFKFDGGIDVESYLFKSGNLEHATDKFFNTSVDVLPVAAPSLNVTEKAMYPLVTGNFYQVGKFNEAGVASGAISRNFGKLSTIRLTVHSESENWVILSEIFIKQRPTKQR